MGKRDVTDWTQKGTQKITKASGPKGKGASQASGIKDTVGKAGLLMCAAAIIAVLAKGVKTSDTWKETRDEDWEEPTDDGGDWE